METPAVCVQIRGVWCKSGYVRRKRHSQEWSQVKRWVAKGSSEAQSPRPEHRCLPWAAHARKQPCFIPSKPNTGQLCTRLGLEAEVLRKNKISAAHIPKETNEQKCRRGFKLFSKFTPPQCYAFPKSTHVVFCRTHAYLSELYFLMSEKEMAPFFMELTSYCQQKNWLSNWHAN